MCSITFVRWSYNHIGGLFVHKPCGYVRAGCRPCQTPYEVSERRAFPCRLCESAKAGSGNDTRKQSKEKAKAEKGDDENNQNAGVVMENMNLFDA
jgi:hypothetical protein